MNVFLYFCEMKVLSFILLVLILSGASCTKSEERSTQASKDYALVLTDVSRVVPLVIHTIQSQSYVLERIRSSEDTLNSCASYIYIAGDTVDINNGNVVLEMLFSQCIDFDGALKNGSLILNISDYFDVDSANCSVQLTDFSINNNIFTGTLGLKRKGSNQFEVSASNLKVFVGTKQITYQGTWLCEIGTGGDVALLYDNSLKVEEEGQLIDRYGGTAQIIGSNLMRDFSCDWFSLGLVELEDEEGESQILDFGNGTCDDVGIITTGENDVTFAIGQ